MGEESDESVEEKFHGQRPIHRINKRRYVQSLAQHGHAQKEVFYGNLVVDHDGDEIGQYAGEPEQGKQPHKTARGELLDGFFLNAKGNDESADDEEELHAEVAVSVK